MNPLTLVKRIQNINSREAALGLSEDASWHAKYKDSAYVFVGGIPFDLTEGDLLAIFAQYGEIVDVNLVRDKGTGKSKGFAFVAYEDQRSTNLAVDNLNGAQILGRVIRVDHVSKYKKKEEEDEEEAQRKREERGVCRAFQRGECTRGAGCKFSHDEQRAANTGWGDADAKRSKWGHDKFEGLKRSEKRPPDVDSSFRAKQKEKNDGKERTSGRSDHEDDRRRVSDRDERGLRKFDEDQHEHRSRNHDRRGEKGRDEDYPKKGRDEKKSAGSDNQRDEKRFRRQDNYDYERRGSGGHDWMEERSRRSESDYAREDRHRKVDESRSYRERGLTSRDQRGRDGRRVSDR